MRALWGTEAPDDNLDTGKAIDIVERRFKPVGLQSLQRSFSMNDEVRSLKVRAIISYFKFYFSQFLDIFVYLETPFMYQQIYQSSPVEMTHLVQ